MKKTIFIAYFLTILSLAITLAPFSTIKAVEEISKENQTSTSSIDIQTFISLFQQLNESLISILQQLNEILNKLSTLLTASQVLLSQPLSSFYDDFATLNSWEIGGDPLPKIEPQFEGKRDVFDNNGDGMYNNFIVSKNIFNFSRGFKIESDVYLKVDDYDGCWNIANFGLTKDTVIPYKRVGDDYYDIPLGLNFGLSYSGEACWASSRHHNVCFMISYLNEKNEIKSYGGGYECNSDPLVDATKYANKWTKLKVVVDKEGYLKFYADEDLIYASKDKLHPEMFKNKRLYLGSRSSGFGGKAYHDYIKVEELSP